MGTFVEPATGVYLCRAVPPPYAHVYTEARTLRRRGTHERKLYANVETWVVIGGCGGDGHALFYRRCAGNVRTEHPYM